MVLDLLEQYEAIVDGLQIFLCLLILFFLVRNHRRGIKPELMSPKRNSDQDFNLQVFSQTINQQVELAFTNILKVAANERRDLVKVLQLHQHIEKDDTPSEGRSPVLTSSTGYPAQSVQEIAGQGERQAHIQKLSTQGMNAKQISDELKTPLGEVELILSLQKNRTN